MDRIVTIRKHRLPILTLLLALFVTWNAFAAGEHRLHAFTSQLPSFIQGGEDPAQEGAHDTIGDGNIRFVFHKKFSHSRTSSQESSIDNTQAENDLARDGIRSMFWFSGISLGFILLFVGIGLVLEAFWLWMFIDCLLHETDEKLVWGLVIWFANLPGAVIYYFIRRKKNR